MNLVYSKSCYDISIPQATTVPEVHASVRIAVGRYYNNIFQFTLMDVEHSRWMITATLLVLCRTRRHEEHPSCGTFKQQYVGFTAKGEASESGPLGYVRHTRGRSSLISFTL